MSLTIEELLSKVAILMQHKANGLWDCRMHGHPLIAFQRPTAREAMEAALELSADNPQWRFSDIGSGDDLAGLDSKKPADRILKRVLDDQTFGKLGSPPSPLYSTNFDDLGF